MHQPSHVVVVDDLFRREAARITAALTRLLGPSQLALVEDVVQEALLSALQAWRFGVPEHPVAWLVAAARNGAIDALRRDRALERAAVNLAGEQHLFARLTEALEPRDDSTDQLAMMFSCCHDALSEDTRVTLVLRFLCGLGPREIASAFLLDTQTIDRRIHRGRERLRSEGSLHDVGQPAEVMSRLPSVLQALYMLFNEGYHGSGDTNPVRASMCAEAMRLTDLLLGSSLTASAESHALQALFCFNAARLSTRLDAQEVFVPLAEQDRSRWDPGLIERGVAHLGASATGDRLTRWHLEAGIACEHTLAASLSQTNWARIVELYDCLVETGLDPVVMLNRALAIAELRGVEAGREALLPLADDKRLVDYPFYWAARADLERRSGHRDQARALYQRAVEASRSHAERAAYQRKWAALSDA